MAFGMEKRQLYCLEIKKRICRVKVYKYSIL